MRNSSFFLTISRYLAQRYNDDEPGGAVQCVLVGVVDGVICRSFRNLSFFLSIFSNAGSFS